MNKVLFLQHKFLQSYYHFILNSSFPFGKLIRFLEILGLVPKFSTSSTPVKFEVIHSLQKKYNIDILVETGTYLGEMVYAQLNHFKEIYSIELNESLYQKAVKRFQTYPQVKLIQGDSGKELIHLTRKIKKRAIFYLDGHFSKGETSKGEKDTPILEEMQAIFQSQIENHILVIDDARLFGAEKHYPTFKELVHFLLKYKPKSKISLKKDMFIFILS